VAEVELVAAGQADLVDGAHGGERRHHDARHQPRGAQCRRYDDAGRRELARLDRVPDGDVAVDAQQHDRHHARSNAHACRHSVDSRFRPPPGPVLPPGASV